MSAIDRAREVANYGLRHAEDGPVFRAVPHELTEALAADVLALASALEDAKRERDAWKRSAQAEIADRAAAEEELAEIKRIKR